MRIYRRRLRPGELDHELVWLLVTTTTAALGAAWLALRLPWPQCHFRALFDIPCVTCGATRSAIALLRGDLAGAWVRNPLATLAMLAIGVFDVYALGVLLTRAPRLRMDLRGWKWLLAGSAGLVAGANWTYLLMTQ